MLNLIVSLALIAVFLPVGIVPNKSDEAFRLERDFNEPLRSVEIENPYGSVEAFAWDGATVKIIATRKGGGAFDSAVLFDRPTGESLKVAVRTGSADTPVSITAFVPGGIHLSVRSDKGAVIIRGLPLAISAETESGNIAFYAPGGAGADLSLRTIEGSIESKLDVVGFGQSTSRLLDGRLGRGGSPVILRTARGRISLLRDDEARSEAISKQMIAATVRASDRARDNLSPTHIEPAAFSGKAGGEAPPPPPGTDEELIKLEARLVNLNVKVVDASGRPVANLKKEDFLLYEDNSQQDIYYFEPATAPLNILLLLDLSGSTESKMKTMKNAAKKFVDALHKEDRIAVAAFSRRFFVISNFTTDHKLLKDRIGDIKNRGSGTAFYDSLWAALDLFEEVKSERKAVVVLTDGVDNSIDHPDDPDYRPRHDFDYLIARMQESDVSVYPIFLDTEYEVLGRRGRGGHNDYVVARKRLEEMADQTGAELFKADRAEDLEGVYQQVASELHSLYSVGYTPKTLTRDGKWRRISVRVSREGARAKTRRGYFSK